MKDEIESKRIIESCTGIAGIAHTRYSTSGKQDDIIEALAEVQPFERPHARLWKRFALAFNGNLANYEELKDEMTKGNEYNLSTSVDTELLVNLLALNLKNQSHENDKKPNLFDVVKSVMSRLDGAYNVVSIFADGDLVAFRDPLGIRPMVWGENEEMYAIASETVALDNIGIRNYQDVLPGECIIINEQGVKRERLLQTASRACQFEYVYFARSNSVIDGTSVYTTRERLGLELAKIEPLKNKLDNSYLVVPAPWTGITASEIFAENLKIRHRVSVTKSDAVRGFINEKSERARIMRSTYNINRQPVSGKKVILIDDSIVRGETSRILIAALREAGATEVHLRLTEPPIKYPCFYGVDFPTSKELIANRATKEFEGSIAKEIGADSVVFQTLEGLKRALGRIDLCTACLTGEYPTSCGQKRFKEQLEK
jgi:amidophosphoribosyltransferase